MPNPGIFPEPFGTGFTPPVTNVSIINTWSKTSDGYFYGTSQLKIPNTQGNWLVAIAQWDEVEDANTLVWVTDDAHNFWQPAALGAVNRGLRTAVLVANNALSTPTSGGAIYPGSTTVSFSSSGFIRNPIFTVIELRGMQAGFVVDAVNTAFAANVTSLNLSLSTSVSDFILASWACQATGSTGSGVLGFGSIGANWNRTGQQTFNGTSQLANGTQGFSVWQVAPGGSYNTTLTSSVNSNWSGVIVGIQAAAGFPSNPYNPAWPLIQCQAAFGVVSNAAPTYYTWTDITPRFLGIKGNRGVDYELAQIDAADFTVTLDNHDGALNPFNTSSPFYPNVLLVTPIRVLLTWQGRTYCVFNGHISHLHQQYEDQYGIVEAECWDDYAKLPLVVLQSSMIQEVLYDKPQFFWPLSDSQGTTSASNISGQTVATLDVSTSKNGTAGVVSAFGTSTGGLGGSQATVWSQTSVTTNFFGSSLRYWDQSGDFPAIPQNGMMEFEVWARMPATNDMIGQLSVSPLMVVEGDLPATAGLIFAVVVGGAAAQFGAHVPGQVYSLQSDNASLIWFDQNGSQHVISSNVLVWDNNWHHFLIQVNATSYNLWIDGTSVLSGGWSLITNTFRMFEIAGATSKFAYGIGPYGGTSVYGGPYGGPQPAFMMGQFAFPAIYNNAIDVERIQSHALSGSTGFTHESTGNRIMRLLQYARWSKPQAIDPGISPTQALNYMGSGLGYGSGGLTSAFGLFGAFGTQATANAGANGTQADIAIQDVTLTENGKIYMDRNGAICFHGRDGLYGRGISCVFSDSFFPLNRNSTFIGNSISPWTGVNGASVSSGKTTWSFAGIGSLLITPNGVTANPGAVSEFIPVSGSASYVFNTWAYSPAGSSAGVSLTVNWFDVNHNPITSVSNTGQYLPPVTPLNLAYSVISPSNAAFATIQPGLLGTPAPSVLLVVDRITLSGPGLAATFEPDIKFNYDVTQLYNDVQVTRNFDQAFARFVDTTSQNKYYPRVYTRTIYDAYQNPPADLNDNAQWVLSAYKNPLLRVESMTCNVAPNPDFWDIALRADAGDLVTVSRTAPGAPTVLSGFVVLKIEFEITQDTAMFTYSLGPILNPVLTLDDPALGILNGSNALGV